MTGSSSADDLPVRGEETGRVQRASPAPAVLTFLIADVRGYTRFTHQHGDEEAGRLAAVFAELARETVLSFGGELIELRGDEALCVFSSARQAVRAAVELQTTFRRATDGRPTFPLPIGVGLDAGESVPIEGGYRGGALNTAARLCSITRPGEILATDTVVNLARRVEGIRYVVRRPVRLKGLETPVRVIEVVPEAGLPPLPAVAVKKRPWMTRRRLTGTAIGGLALMAGLAAFLVTRSNGPAALARVAPNAIGVINSASGSISSEVKLESIPSAIATGGGFVWVANESAGTVSRLDPASGALQSLSLGGRLGGIAYGAGSLWVTKSEERGLVQINPRTSAVVQTITVGNAPGAVAVGKGAVWVVNTVDGTVSRIDLGRGAVSDTIPVGLDPAGVAVARSAVWVASEGSGSVLRIDPSSRVIAQVINVGNGPTGVAVGAGAVWVANTRDGTISRIDPVSDSVSATVRVGADPSAIAAGPDAIWVGNGGGDTLSRIDPGTASVTRTVTVGSRPSGIALAGGAAYATTGVPLAGHRGGVLTVESEPSTCRCADPVVALGPNVTDLGVADLVYDGLVAYRRVGGVAGAELVPDLSARLPASADGGRTYSVQLRDGIHYSDATRVTASDFRAGVERSLAISRAASAFRGVLGAKGCLARPGKPCDLSRGIDANDVTGMITIHLSQPDPDFVYKLALPEASLVPAREARRVTPANSIPGTGPYRIAAFHPDREILLVRNPQFHVWSPDARPDGYPDRIRFRLRVDPRARLRQVENGSGDWVSLGDPSLTAEVQRGVLTRHADTFHSDPSPGTFWVVLNSRVSPFDNLRVRRALNYAIDRQALIRLTGGLARPTCQILPPSFPGYRPYCPYTRDPNPAGTWTAPDFAKARALVARSGTAGTHVEVAGTKDPVPLQVDRYLVSLLRRLGYRTSLRLFTGADLVAHVANSRNRAQIAGVGWFADSLTPSNFLHLFACASFVPKSSANLNLFEYCDQRLDAKIREAAALQASDPARADALAEAADRAIVDQAAALPWANPRREVLVSECVGNYQSHPLWGTLLDQLWVK